MQNPNEKNLNGDDLYNNKEKDIINQINKLNNENGDYKLTYISDDGDTYIDIEPLLNPTMNVYKLQAIATLLQYNYDYKIQANVKSCYGYTKRRVKKLCFLNDIFGQRLIPRLYNCKFEMADIDVDIN